MQKIYISGGAYLMKDFPEFMKNHENHIDSSQQSRPEIDGYFYEGASGGQMAFWTYPTTSSSTKHTHEFDEYVVCVHGQYTAFLNDEKVNLLPGDELFIPSGTEHWEERIAGTRTIHAFGGKRIVRKQSDK